MCEKTPAEEWYFMQKSRPGFSVSGTMVEYGFKFIKVLWKTLYTILLEIF